MAVDYGLPAGSPDWYLRKLVDELMNRQPRYDTCENYYLGTQPPPKGDPKLFRSLKHYQLLANSNYIPLIANSPVERMRITGFKFGADADVDQDAKLIWAANNMELQSKILHSGAAVFGDCYALVGPVDETTGYPTITVEDPRVAIVEPHPIYPTKSVAGLRMWQDTVEDVVFAVLYFPETIYTYVARGYPFNTKLTKDAITKNLLSGAVAGSFELVEVQENPLGEVPLVRFAWQPDFTRESLAEAELVFNIQDRINQLILDRMKIVKNSAYPQRHIKGGLFPKKKAGSTTKKGPIQPPFDPGADTVWVVDNPEAEFGEFSQADFKQVLEAVQDDVGDMLSITKTPAHYTMNRMVNVSGDTLTQSESAFISKTMLRQESMGWGWEQAMRIAFKYMNLAKSSETEALVLWAPVGLSKDVDAADAFSKYVSAGIPPEIVAAHIGNFSADEITYIKQKVEEQKQQEQANLDKQVAIKQASGNNESGNKTKP